MIQLSLKDKICRLHRWRRPSHKGEHRRKSPSHPPHEPKVGRSTIFYAYMSNGENQSVKASALLTEQPESHYIGDLLGVLNEEELIRLRRRLEKTGKLRTAEVLADQIRKRFRT